MRIQYFIIICQDKLVSFFNYVTLFQLTSYENRTFKSSHTSKSKYSKLNPLYGVYSGGDHLFPFRTEKLSPPAQMVLGLKPGRVCRCQFFNKTPSV
jgi:hypothetical protein